MKQILITVFAIATLLTMSACEMSGPGYYAAEGILGDGYQRNSFDQFKFPHERIGYRQEDSGSGDRGGPYYKTFSRDSFQSRSQSRSGFQSSDARVIKVAGKYDITHYAATYIVRAVELAKVNDESGIKDLGLSKKDFQRVLKGNLSDEKVEILGSKLLMSNEDVEQLIVEMKKDIEYANSKN